jgi:DNA-binding beta-propeller fold protein YncE
MMRLAFSFLGFAMTIVSIAATATVAGDPLVFVRAIPMANIHGRIDHLTIDTTQHHLFVAALGNDTVEVLDTESGATVRSLPGFHEPQGIGQPLAGNVVAIANGGSGDLVMVDRATFKTLHTAALGDDADNVRFDVSARRFYVGYGSGAIGAVSEDGSRAGDVKLSAHPESFQLETAGPRIFVNVPNAHHIAVIDRSAMKVLTTWPVTSAAANYPMALDEAGHRLYVGCRRPAVVLVFDTQTGTQLTSIPTVGDTDDMFFDARRKRVYVIGGEGFVDVFDTRGDHLQRIAHLATTAGARTGLFVAPENRLYLAVPRRGAQNAEIRVFEVRD